MPIIKSSFGRTWSPRARSWPARASRSSRTSQPSLSSHELLPEPRLVNLAGRRARKLLGLAEDEPGRDLVAGEPLAAEGDDRPRVGPRGWVKLQHRDHDLVLVTVGNADHVRLLDARMLEEDALHLERRHVDAAGLDHLLQPTPEAHPPVLADQPEVTCMEISFTVEGGRVELGCPKIAWRDMTGDAQLANLPRGQRPPRLRVRHADVHAGQRQALRVQAPLERIMGVGDRAVAVRLRRSVYIAELASAHRLHRHLDVLRETDGQAGAHRAELPPGTIGMLQHGARHVRHAVVDARS